MAYKALLLMAWHLLMLPALLWMMHAFPNRPVSFIHCSFWLWCSDWSAPFLLCFTHPTHPLYLNQMSTPHKGFPWLQHRGQISLLQMFMTSPTSTFLSMLFFSFWYYCLNYKLHEGRNYLVLHTTLCLAQCVTQLWCFINILWMMRRDLGFFHLFMIFNYITFSKALVIKGSNL